MKVFVGVSQHVLTTNVQTHLQFAIAIYDIFMTVFLLRVSSTVLSLKHSKSSCPPEHGVFRGANTPIDLLMDNGQIYKLSTLSMSAMSNSHSHCIHSHPISIYHLALGEEKNKKIYLDKGRIRTYDHE